MAALSPLSVGQESLWFLYQLAPGSAAYNTAGAGRLSPVPDLTALSRAVKTLVARHDLLRSVFTEAGGVPGRSVMDTGLVDLEVRDASGLDDADLRRAARAVAVAPFALADSGPLRVVLLRRQTDAVLLVGDHHIATDATSHWLVWRDLLGAYQAYAAGREPSLPAPGGSYDDYVAAERRLLDSPRRAELAAYWHGVCAGAAAAELPTDRPRPERQSFAGATCQRRLSAELADRVRRTAARLGVTPFAFLLSIFQALVYRYTGADDFLLGCPTSTRRTRRSRDVVGYFVNTMVLRARLGPATTFAGAAAAAGHEVLAGTRHVGYPFPLLLRSLDRSPGSGLPPPFRIAVTMVTASRFGATIDRLANGDAAVVDGELRLEPIEVPRLEGQYDLNVEILQSKRSLVVSFRYDTGLFDEPTIARALDSFLRLTEVAVADPSTRISRASLVAADDRARLLALGAGATAIGREVDHGAKGAA